MWTKSLEVLNPYEATVEALKKARNDGSDICSICKQTKRRNARKKI